MTDVQWAVLAAAAVALTWVITVNLRERKRAQKATPARSSSLTQEPPMTKVLPSQPDAPLPTELVDAIATLRWPTPISVYRVLQQIRGWRRVGTKPLAFGWLTAGELVTEPQGETVGELHVGLLLATRSGPVHAMEFSEWQNTLNQIAAALGAQLEVPPMTVVLARARTLDQQCAAVDAQLSLCVSVDEVLTVPSIQSAADQLGLEPRGESRFVALDAVTGQPRFSVFPGDTGTTLVFLLDVPRTESPSEAFQEMQQAATGLAQALSGRLTDEAGRELSAQDLQMIEAQVLERAEKLLALGFAPGSVITQRLFL
jgi:hypothetical protein